MEATPGFEPGIRVLQTRALPLGYSANFNIKIVEQVVGIEPTTKAWEAFVLPLNYIRNFSIYYTTNNFFWQPIGRILFETKNPFCFCFCGNETL